MGKRIIEFPAGEFQEAEMFPPVEKQYPEISLGKTLKIGSLQGSAEGVSKATNKLVRVVGGIIEEDDGHFTVTLVVPKLFRFGTNVAKMIADMWRVAEDVIMVANETNTRMTFAVKDIYQK